MSKDRRLGTLLLCIGFVLTLSASCAYLSLEAGHECVGAHCDTCEHIHELTALLHGFALFMLLLFAALLAVAAQRHAFPRNAAMLAFTGSPVSWKVRLNN